MSGVRLTYDGPALQAHTMDGRLLAPALLAFGDLCEQAAQALYGDGARVRVEVRASFKTGSFGIDLSVSQQLTQQIMAWLACGVATAAANAKTLLEAIGLAGAGLIGLLRWLRGRRINRVDDAPDGKRRITVDDGDAIEVEERVIVLLQRHSVRESLYRVVQPPEREGNERLAMGDDRAIGVVIERSEAAYFQVPPPEDAILLEEVRTIAFSIVSLSFREDNKWRLYDGQVSPGFTAGCELKRLQQRDGDAVGRRAVLCTGRRAHRAAAAGPVLRHARGAGRREGLEEVGGIPQRMNRMRARRCAHGRSSPWPMPTTAATMNTTAAIVRKNTPSQCPMSSRNSIMISPTAASM